MKQTFGIIFLIAALALAYIGYDKLQSSKVGIKIGELEISASDKSSNETAYIFFGLAAISLLGGIVMLSKNKT